MDFVNIQFAKTYLSRLLSRVRNGEEIVIANRGKPFAKIVPYRDGGTSRADLLGMDRMSVKISDDFEQAVPDEFLAPFYEEKEN